MTAKFNALGAIVFLSASTFAEISVERIEIAPPSRQSRVPSILAQDRFLAPQAVSAVHVSADGKFITVGTMAFSHDANVWQFSADGDIITKRHLPPWAPMQVATLQGGHAVAVGLAYSRVTSPDPTVWFGPTSDLFANKLNDQFVEADPSEGQLARLRPGAGDWRNGWLASHFGDFFVSGPDWVFKPPRWWLDSDGQRHALQFEHGDLLPTSRAVRMASSADGKRIAFAWLGLSQEITGLPHHAEALSIWSVDPNKKLWSAPFVEGAAPPLPDPVRDFPEMAKQFNFAADTIVPGHVASSVTLNRDGSVVAAIDYATHSWLRTKPAIGKWDPPIHALNFLPTQRGVLRIFDQSGRETFHEELPEKGMFEVALNSKGDAVWSWPTAWFARGMAGAPWLPVDSEHHSVYSMDINSRRMVAFTFPDEIADCALSANGQILVSCWDNRLYLIANGELVASLDVGAPARLAWSPDGQFAVAGTADGRLLQIDKRGQIKWTRAIPITEIPPLTETPPEVVKGLPIFQGGRFPGEHAYVGDIWILKTGSKGVIVDAGGLSGFAITQARLRALGIEQITHVLHTHSHGDHSGGAYLWRTLGAKIVAPKPAELALTWLMPMLTDYGIYPPRPVDLALPLSNVGDETDFELSGLKFHALFVPGHSFDLTVYETELNGKRVAFTGDLGFDNQDIVHRCWGDKVKAAAVLHVIREKLLSWKPDVVFTGHDVHANGTEFLTKLIHQTERSLAAAD